jgi:hypothetical protein
MIQPADMHMRQNYWLFFVLILISLQLPAQEKPTLDYYLPSGKYTEGILAPAEYLGYEVGSWHTSHDQLLGYMRHLANRSKRIKWVEYGRSHENRPLLCLIISDQENLANLESIQAQRSALANPTRSSTLDLRNMPAVWYAGYSIHGNETSGSHAALLFAYYLAAGESAEVSRFLKNTVVLLDPCFNPDGMQRFSGWVNSRRSRSMVTDPAADEYREPWPQGRTNHYWFDLNRDWLVMQQPESAGRVNLLQQWKPNVLTDHHEMGSNSTFFFQPGVPARVNPITPTKNQELTAKIATYHAKMLSEKQIEYFTRESYDDYYYGKGSTYPDANGGIGILFEQASSRGSAQETEHGILTFPYSIRNQVLTSRSTLQAVSDMRPELNAYLREFYQQATEEAAKDPIKAYIFGSPDGNDALEPLLQMLRTHRINFFATKRDIPLDNLIFQPGTTLVVPTDQPQYRLIKGIFSHPTTFKDSIFYDISAWTLPYALGLDFGELTDKNLNPSILIPYLPPTPPDVAATNATPCAYAIAWNHPAAPATLYQLLQQNIRVKVATEPFTMEGKQFPRGTLLVPTDRQQVEPEALGKRIRAVAPPSLPVHALTGGLSTSGPDLGSAKFEVLKKPEVLLLTGNGVNPSDAGEIWHLLDTRYHIPVTLLDHTQLNRINVNRYNVVILPDGNYNPAVEKIKEITAAGTTIIAVGDMLHWLKNNSLLPLEFRTANSTARHRAYNMMNDDRGALRMPGAIFEAQLDLTHPLCFGYTRPTLPIFLSDGIFIDPLKNAYNNPVVLTQQPLLAGYVNNLQKPLAAGSAGVLAGKIGKANVICFAGNPNFRAFWYGTNRMLANALFFGQLIQTDNRP